MSNGDNSNSTGRCLNPPFVHAIAVPDLDMLDKTDKVCVVARGDGVVDIINVEYDLSSTKSKNFSKSKTKPSPKDTNNQEQHEKKMLHLDSSLRGHTAAVSSVTFSTFGDRGKFIISGSNDKSIKAWDWTKLRDVGESSSISDFSPLNIDLSKKVNWLCTTPNDSENLVVCDTTKVVKVFTIS